MSFKRLEPEDLLVSADSVVTSAWSNGTVELESFYTSSTQYSSTSRNYYVNVYDVDADLTSSAEVQFTIGYGHKNGSGSVLFTDSVETSTQSPSSVIYGQMRTLLLGDEESDFIFDASGSSYTPDDIYVITFDRSRYKESIKPNTLELKIGDTVLRDNSSDVSSITFTDAGRVFELVSGSNGEAVPNSGSYGKLFPDVGIIVLNPAALDEVESLGTDKTGNNDSENPKKLFNKLSSFKAQSQETLSSNFIFARARNNEFNYTTNPSFLTGSGEIRYEELINSPETYITTVGMYNDNQDLLAVAKLSRPLLKNSTKEALIRIKLDY